MLQPKAVRRARRQRPKVVPQSIPAPVTGWNTRDALDAMAPTDAVTLDNWFPTTGKVTVRRGYTQHSAGMGSNTVDTLAEYHAGATRKLIAAGTNSIWDATSSTATELASGFTSSQWQTRNFNGRLFFVNGTDTPQTYDGSSVAASGWTGTGLTASNLIGVNVHKSRLYFWEVDSQDFWYSSVNAVTGTLTKFPLSRVGQFGGNLIAMGTWTVDGGNGPDDRAVFVMSSGEIIVYAGSDPGDAAEWALVGIYQIGVPLGVRGIVKAGPDLLIMTRDDFVSMSAVLQTGQLGEASKLSGAIQAVSSNHALFGWQSVIWKSGGMILFNIPATTNSYHQYVVNATTGAACRFTGIYSRCWATYNGGLYFGGQNGTVYQYDTAWSDAGSPINADGKSAWSSLGGAVRSRVAAVRPIIQSQGSIDYSYSIGFDFNDSVPTLASSISSASSFWDTAIWDVSLWSTAVTTDTTWKVAQGTGQSISTRVKVSEEQEISWLRTDFRLEQGICL